MKKINLLIILLAIIPLVSANSPYDNIHVKVAEGLILFSPLLFLIEILLFWLGVKDFLNVKISFVKSIKIVLIANIPTILLGFLITFPLSVVFVSIPPLAFLLTPSILFAISVTILVEFLIYTLFFTKDNISKIKLLLISAVTNLLSYSVLALLYTSIASYCHTHGCFSF